MGHLSVTWLPPVNPKPKMKIKKFNLGTEGLKGLFASIVENGAMVSLAGKWVYLNDIKSGNPKNLETKIVKKTRIVEGVKTSVDVTMYRTSSLSDMFRGFAWRVISGAFPGTVKFSGRLKVVKLFLGYIYKMYNHHGEVITVKYLKAAQLAVQKSIGKDVIDSLSVLEPALLHTKLTGFKLPVIIPSRDRKLINGGSNSIIRFWLTLFSCYRVIEIPGVLKLNTIMDQLTVPVESLQTVNRDLLNILKKGNASSLFDMRILRKPASLLLLETASATNKVSWIGMFSDPKLLSAYGQSEIVKNLLKVTGQSDLLALFELFNEMSGEISLPSATLASVDNPYKGASILDPEFNYTGKLSIKSEAAGKERVFAMVDFWTQQALKPIHSLIFKTLRSLPNDGTFDQGASVRRAAGLALYYKQSFGYDLSAATDRLPLLLQGTVLDFLLPGLGSL